MQSEHQASKVIVVGGGLSGLSAAFQLLKLSPSTEVTLLEANDYLGGRTKSITINDCVYDEGGEYIGPKQFHSIELAQQSGNQLVKINDEGRKILEFAGVVGSYTSQIPNNVSLPALLNLQWVMWKIDRMAAKVPSLNPRDCELGAHWDSMTVRSWVDQNLYFEKVKLMLEGALRVIMGVELGEISMLYLLHYIHLSGSFEALITVKGGLQQNKTKKGTQHMSIYLGEQVEKRGGKILLNESVKQISQTDTKCQVVTYKGTKYEADYLIMAMPPSSVTSIRFTPLLSPERRLFCERSFMGNLAKVILLYRDCYWKKAGFSGQALSDCHDSPVMNAFDDTRINNKGEVQPALVVFIGGAVWRQWKHRPDMKQKLVDKLAQYYKEPQMKNPIAMHYRNWDEQGSIGGAPVCAFPPGLLSQVEDMRRPEGRIHWAGTELATVSTGFMDGAIQSGKRVAQQVGDRVNQSSPEAEWQSSGKPKESLPYFKKANTLKKPYFEWW